MEDLKVPKVKKILTRKQISQKACITHRIRREMSKEKLQLENINMIRFKQKVKLPTYTGNRKIRNTISLQNLPGISMRSIVVNSSREYDPHCHIYRAPTSRQGYRGKPPPVESIEGAHNFIIRDNIYAVEKTEKKIVRKSVNRFRDYIQNIRKSL